MFAISSSLDSKEILSSKLEHGAMLTFFFQFRCISFPLYPFISLGVSVSIFFLSSSHTVLSSGTGLIRNTETLTKMEIPERSPSSSRFT